MIIIIYGIHHNHDGHCYAMLKYVDLILTRLKCAPINRILLIIPPWHTVANLYGP